MLLYPLFVFYHVPRGTLFSEMINATIAPAD